MSGLRRYAPMKPSRARLIPIELRLDVLHRDLGCVGIRAGLPIADHFGALEVDHVRASHGTGMKSRTELDNLVTLCSSCHRWKTEHGKIARPLLLAYLAGVGAGR